MQKSVKKIGVGFVLMFLAGTASTMPVAEKKAEQERRAHVIAAVNKLDLRQIAACCKSDNNFSDELVQDCQREFKRYFALCAIFPHIKFEMYSREVDLFWHTFLLFSKQYADSCQSVMGNFLHHAPHTEKCKASLDVSVKCFNTFASHYKQIFGQEPPRSVWGFAQSTDLEISCEAPCAGECTSMMGEYESETNCWNRIW